MFQKTTRCASLVERCRTSAQLISQNKPSHAHSDLNDLKKLIHGIHSSNRDQAKKREFYPIDFLRGQAFLLNKDLWSSRQAFLEELNQLETHPRKTDEMSMIEQNCWKNVQKIEFALHGAFSLPEIISEKYPFFSTIYYGINQYSMLSWMRLLNLYKLVESLSHEMTMDATDPQTQHHVSFVECGVGAGGSSLILAAAAEVCFPSNFEVTVHSFDTFCGLPIEKSVDARSEDGKLPQDVGWGAGTCSGHEQTLRHLMQRYSLKTRLHTHRGLLEHTLPSFLNQNENTKIALLHLDVDWYESTSVCLTHLYPKLMLNGFMQVDDFHYWSGCQKAYDEYFEEWARSGRHVPIKQPIDGNAIYIKKYR